MPVPNFPASPPALPWTKGEPPTDCTIEGHVYLLDLGGDEAVSRFALCERFFADKPPKAGECSDVWMTIDGDEIIECEVLAYIRLA